jgi:uncharacterized membrane protein HdeD (DUF308 family)
MEAAMLEQRSRYWWLFLLRGIFAILFGVFMLGEPVAALSALLLIFGLFALADGVVALFYALSPSAAHRWALAFGGALGIAVGIITIRSPSITALALYAYIAFWAIFVGVAQIAFAIRLRQVIEHEGLAILAGVLQVVLGVLLLALPRAGVISLVWLIALYAFIAGGLQIALAIRLHNLGRLPTPQMPVTQP